MTRNSVDDRKQSEEIERAGSALKRAVCSFAELRERARAGGPRRVGIVAADDDVALTAAFDAWKLGIASPVLLGDIARIRAKAEALGLEAMLAKVEVVSAGQDVAHTAARMARDGDVDILLKGHLRTDELLHAVLDKQNQLRTGRLLSDVLLFEFAGEDGVRLVGLTDGGLNVAPTLEQKKEIVANAIEVFHCLGIERPKIAIMSATEAVSESVPSTVHARELTQLGIAGVFGTAEVYGPLAVDNALWEWAAKAKGIHHPVAGHADCLVAPNIEAGNMFGKAVKFLCRGQCAHVVVGAKIPILIPSRVESAEDKVNAIAMGVLFAAR